MQRSNILSGDDAIVTLIEGEITPPRHGGAAGVAEQQRDHAKHGGGAPAGCRNLAVMPGRNAAPNNLTQRAQRAQRREEEVGPIRHSTRLFRG